MFALSCYVCCTQFTVSLSVNMHLTLVFATSIGRLISECSEPHAMFWLNLAIRSKLSEQIYSLFHFMRVGWWGWDSAETLHNSTPIRGRGEVEMGEHIILLELCFNFFSCYVNMLKARCKNVVFDKGRETTFGSSYREFQKIEGSRNPDSTVYHTNKLVGCKCQKNFGKLIL